MLKLIVVRLPSTRQGSFPHYREVKIIISESSSERQNTNREVGTRDSPRKRLAVHIGTLGCPTAVANYLIWLPGWIVAFPCVTRGVYRLRGGPLIPPCRNRGCTPSAGSAIGVLFCLTTKSKLKWRLPRVFVPVGGARAMEARTSECGCERQRPRERNIRVAG